MAASEKDEFSGGEMLVGYLGLVTGLLFGWFKDDGGIVPAVIIGLLGLCAGCFFGGIILGLLNMLLKVTLFLLAVAFYPLKQLIAIARRPAERTAERRAERERENERQKEELRTRIRLYEEEAQSIFDDLRHRQITPNTAQREKERNKIIQRRKEIQERLANHEANLEALIERKKSAQSPEDVAVAIVEIQSWITYLNTRLKELEVPTADNFMQLDDRLLIEEGISRQPNNPVFYVKRAKLNNYKSHLQKAIADCNHALQLLPDYPSALRWRGVLYKCKGNLTDAMWDFQRIINVDLDNEFSHLAFSLLADIFNRQGKYCKAIQQAAETLRCFKPQLSHTLEQLAIGHEHLGELESAISYYTQILHCDPTLTKSIRPKRARLLHRVGRDELALHDAKWQVADGNADFNTYNLLIELEPNEPLHYYGRSETNDELYKKFEDKYKAFHMMNERGVSKEAVAKFVDILKEMSIEWSVGRSHGSWPSPDEMFAATQEAINVAHFYNDCDALLIALRLGIKTAQESKRFDFAVKWAEQRLTISQTLVGRDKQKQIHSAYDDLLFSLTDAEELSRALSICHDAMQSCELFGHICNLVVKLYDKGQYDETAAQLEIIGERYSDTANESTIDLAATVSHWLAGTFAGCHELPIFNLEKARYFARKACQLSSVSVDVPSLWFSSEALTPGKGANETTKYVIERYIDPSKAERLERYQRHFSPHLACAARLWAISEAITPGDGNNELANCVTDPIIRERGRTEGQKQMEQLGISSKVAM